MAKRTVYSFRESKYSKNSVISAMLGIGAMLVLGILLIIAYLLKGRAGAWIGAFGVTGILMSVMGLRYGYAGFRDECRSYLCSRMGTVFSMMSIIVWFFIVCLGIVSMM